MPTKYKRKIQAKPRRSWTVENLVEAVNKINNGEMGVNKASRVYKIPSRSLRRRKQSGNVNDIPLGPSGCLGPDNEKRLVKHTKALEKQGFAPDRECVRYLAFQFAEKLGVGEVRARRTVRAR